MTRTLDLPSHTDAAAVKEVAELLREHTTSDGQLADLAWEWAQQAAASNGDAEATYRRVLDAAEVDPEATAVHAEIATGTEPLVATPNRTRESDPDDPGADEQPGVTDNLAAALAHLQRRIEGAEPRTHEPLTKWRPEKEPVLCGQVVLVEALNTRSRDGVIRVIVVRRSDGELREVWASLQQLAAGLRAIEIEHGGRTLRVGDLLALRHTGTARLGRSQHESKLFAIEAVLQP